MQPFIPTFQQPYDPDLYTLTREGQCLIWQITVQPGEQAYVWRGSALTTGDTTDGGKPKAGSPHLVTLNLTHDGVATWNMTIGIGPVGPAAAAAGLALPTYPIPAGPGPWPPAGGGAVPISLADELIVQHDNPGVQTLRCSLVVLVP